ncbi:helix-turn-helix domain-containing protein [Streptomyces sp. NPDC127079]|uniref:helix-turn-helix domain-containing protein n=1 Tax=Streptomyces sp. NPDC127079 TaxID=3347132 RepID=UPI0036522639
MVASPHGEKFAARLRMLKERSGRGYDRLGKEAGVSGSSLHRYCSGLSVPTDYRVVHAFAKVCGASAAELRELHRLWALADADREAATAPLASRPAQNPKPKTAPETPTGQEPGEGAKSDADPEPGGGAKSDADPESGVGRASGADSESGGDPRAGMGTKSRPGLVSGSGNGLSVASGSAPWSASAAGEPAVAVPEEAAAHDVTPVGGARGRPGAGRPRRLRVPEKPSSRSAILATVAAVALVAGLVWLPGRHSDGAAPATGDKLLYSPACKTVSMGQHDECVREVQTLLARARGKLAVDGDFGPETLRRLTAFQVLAGLPATSVADDATRNALYAQRVSMTTWSTARVARRIREVFVEDPGTAVAIARCASFLDPLYVLPNTNGSRNWGVFQISDARLRDLGGTPLRAFDPDWNIRAAHRLWSVRHDFHDWPSCQAALKATSETPPEITPETTPETTPESTPGPTGTAAPKS